MPSKTARASIKPYPMVFSRRTKTTVWGGYRLYDKLAPGEAKKSGFSKISEVWSLCEDRNVVVINGPLAFSTLGEVVARSEEEFYGREYLNYFEGLGHFPLLLKMIDANDRLSIQVHPDNFMAKLIENYDSGKTEMWYVVDAAEGSEVVMGFSKRVTPAMFRKKLADGKLETILHRVKVKPGDVLFIPSGRLHAIGAGILIAEIQQHCDITYRVYDYGRLDDSGKPRQLHVDKAIKCTNFGDVKPSKIKPVVAKSGGHTTILMAACNYFTTLFHKIDWKNFVFRNSLPVFSVFMNAGEPLDVVYDGGSAEMARYSAMVVPAACREVEFVSRAHGRPIELVQSYVIPYHGDNLARLREVFGPDLGLSQFDTDFTHSVSN